MDVFTQAIRRVMRADIPEEILYDAFIDQSQRIRRSPLSIEQQIRTEIIRKQVMMDLANVGGVMVDIPLNGIPYTTTDNFQKIFTIPMSKTFGRLITSVMGIYMNVTSNFNEAAPGQTVSPYYNPPIARSVNRVINSYRPMPLMANARCEVTADNVITVRDYMCFSPDSTMRVKLQYSEDFSELKRAYYKDFAELVLWATKAYIYRKLALRLDRAALDAGREFGRYKEFVDEYRDANTTYDTLLDEKWGRILILNDQKQKEVHLDYIGRART